MTVFSFSRISYLFPPLIFAQLAASAYIPTSYSGASGVNGTDAGVLAPLGTSVPSTTSLGTNPANCADDVAWKSPTGFQQADCQDAMIEFYDGWVKGQENSRYEFLGRDVKPLRAIHITRLPLKITSGTCTIALAMRVDFEQGELPGEPPTTGSAPSDVTTFWRLYKAAQNVDKTCIALTRRPGWYAEGDLKSIAVAIWPTDSVIDKKHGPYGRLTGPGPPSLIDLASPAQASGATS